ncbi:proton channel OtopLc-like [Anneissia japonica]|uniref:proton channel OtopLc-like n=1 Tax=Anneissia japonica TaxID=1529436 RepID=UPI001425A92F|nr:proton channel OtopLc-like [Anneissia japonica]
MYMVMSVLIILSKIPYNIAYESIMFVCFYLAQLIYLDRYSQVCFNNFKIYERFGIMHLLGTNIVFWFEIVVYDTKEDYYDSHYPEDYPTCSLRDDLENNDLLSYISTAKVYVGAFAVEYCLIAVCLLRSMWSNVGRAVTRRNTKNISKRTYPVMESLYGIIGGVLVLSVIIALGVCMFIKICPLCLYYIQIMSCIYGFICLFSFTGVLNTNILDKGEGEGCQILEGFSSSVLYDGVLLLFCFSLFILQTMYKTLSAIIQYKITHLNHGYTLLFITFSLYFFSSISQTLLIIIWQTHSIDRSRQHRLSKNLLIFLTITNFAMWIGGHYELKLGQFFFKSEADLYGKFMWYIIHHITGPFQILYFFHSSVCLFEIWTLFGSV